MLQRMTYIGCMFGFEMSARIGEYTQKERGRSDHCVRNDDLSFAVETPTQQKREVGSALAVLPQVKAGEGFSQIVECRVQGTSTKGKVTVKAKILACRSSDEIACSSNDADSRPKYSRPKDNRGRTHSSVLRQVSSPYD